MITGYAGEVYQLQRFVYHEQQGGEHEDDSPGQTEDPPEFGHLLPQGPPCKHHTQRCESLGRFWGFKPVLPTAQEPN
jgi:hypothetical protein